MKKIKSLLTKVNKSKLFILSFSILLFTQTLILANIQIVDGNGIYFIKDLAEEVILDSKTVYISGLIKTPGVYYLDENETLQDLINKAGGFIESENLKQIISEYNLSSIPNNGDSFDIK